jgi:choice-of-anchor C domain-containing protein
MPRKLAPSAQINIRGMNMKILGLIAGAALFLGAQSAYAVSITNGSFESGVGPGSFTQIGAGSPNITGWTVDSGTVDYIGTYWTSSDGNRSVDMSGGSAGQISQVLNGLSTGQQYTISFDIAGNPAGAPVSKDLWVSVGGISSLYSFSTTGHTLADMGWSTQTFVFVATAASQTLSFLSGTPGSFGAALDNVTIAATPIPGAILLFGSALGGMGFLGYRRKKLEAAA